jgi:hypothetical protein
LIMHCDDMLPLVEKLADGECTEPEKIRAEAHLAECTSCQEHLRFLQALPEAVRQAPLPEPPGAYWDVLPRKVMARIREESSQEHRGWVSEILAPARLRWLGALAAGAVAIVLSYEVLTLQRERQPMTPIQSVEEPILEEAVESGISKTVPDVVAGEAEETTDQEKLLVGGALQTTRPSSIPVEQTLPPVRARKSARKEPSSGVARAPQEQETAEGITDVAGPREPAPIALGVAAGRGEAPAAETPAPVVVEGAEEPDEAVAPRATAPSPRKMGVSEDLSRLRSRAQVPEREADKLEERSVMRTASQGGKQFSRVAVSEKDRETTSVSEYELEAECAALRDSLDPSKKSDEQKEVRYRLARCSIRLYQLRQKEQDQRRAVEDASAYLEVQPQGERADEIRKLLELIQNNQ